VPSPGSGVQHASCVGPADARDDAAYGPDRRGDELPAELARREQRLETIQAAKAVL